MHFLNAFAHPCWSTRKKEMHQNFPHVFGSLFIGSTESSICTNKLPIHNVKYQGLQGCKVNLQAVTLAVFNNNSD